MVQPRSEITHLATRPPDRLVHSVRGMVRRWAPEGAEAHDRFVIDLARLLLATMEATKVRPSPIQITRLMEAFEDDAPEPA